GASSCAILLHECSVRRTFSPRRRRIALGRRLPSSFLMNKSLLVTVGRSEASGPVSASTCRSVAWPKRPRKAENRAPPGYIIQGLRAIHGLEGRVPLARQE